MKRKVLITGGMGYLGSRLVQYLQSVGDYSLLIATRTRPLKKPEWAGAAEIVTIDLSNPNQAVEICQDVGAVIHLGAPNEKEAAADPLGCLCGAARDTFHLLNALPKGGKFIYISTAHVYGSPLSGAISENTVPKPRHPYAITRRMCEDLVLAKHRPGLLDCVVLRLSNGIGYPAHPHHTQWNLIGNDLCRQAVNEGKVILKSSGNQLRDFIPMHDVLRAIHHAISLPSEKIGDGLFNLGGERTMSILDMARFIVNRCEQVAGYRPELIVPTAVGEALPPPLKFEIEKWKATGFTLTTPLEQEIDATLKFCLEAKKHEALS